MLDQQPKNIIQGELIAHEISKALDPHNPASPEIRRLEDGPVGSTPIMLGNDRIGQALDAPTKPSDPWPVVGIADAIVAQWASALVRGDDLGPWLSAKAEALPIKTIGDIAEVGPVDRLVGSKADDRPRGAFLIHPERAGHVPDRPCLWAHDAARERRLIVSPDSYGQVRDASNEGIANANRIWATASTVHYNRDLRFNAQSLIVALTPAETLGGRAWPSIKLHDPAHNHAFSLFCNSTFGLLLHWWASNKTQSGRGTVTVTTLADIPTLDIRALDQDQIEAARQAFNDLKHCPFLPFDQIDEDVCRHELDRRLLVDILRFPPETCHPGGPIDILRRKLAAEPQIHGGKKSRLQFVHPENETPINPAPAPPPPNTPITHAERKTAR